MILISEELKTSQREKVSSNSHIALKFQTIALVPVCEQAILMLKNKILSYTNTIKSITLPVALGMQLDLA